MTGRIIDLESCPNFRDLGGYGGLDGRSVRWRRLFRSMTPEHISREDMERTRELGITLVVDLRGPRFRSSGPLGESPARRIAPGRRRVLARNREEAAAYAKLSPEEALGQVVERMGRIYARAASAIAANEGASLVHCRLGKDRTGVFSAVLLKLLGASDADVIDDYLLSERFLDRSKQLLARHESNDEPIAHSRVADEPPSRAAMVEVLRVLEMDYGGAEAYLRQHGLKKREVEVLRRNLLATEI